mmetsp:Transcript_9876/g.40803  ORF Transcript_9876/g.40803 Transcript_9876/m.40803 type:complete len:554 (-) Transcript_9876:238-1899(-)
MGRGGAGNGARAWTYAPRRAAPTAEAAASMSSAQSPNAANGSAPATDVEGLKAMASSMSSGETLSIVVVGASGDLARKKIFPALYSLYYDGWLPEHFTVCGYARSDMTQEEFHERIAGNLTCRVDHDANPEACEGKVTDFLERCVYFSGGYGDAEAMGRLHDGLSEEENNYKVANRVFFLSVPPTVFVDAAVSASRAASSQRGWTRVIVEKPFGRDSESFGELDAQLGRVLTEEQIYRIDHYLGKELIENLMVLRFSNLIFEPLWNRDHIRNVQITFSEDFGTDGRGGYFDHYGIIRDIMQNHLLQIMALFAMEQPTSLAADDVRDEKVKLLRSMKPIDVNDVVVGQYIGREVKSGYQPGYLEDPTVPDNSNTPTFAAAAFFIDNPRWDGVPFLMKAGKALHERKAEIRIQFRHVPGSLYSSVYGGNLDLSTNELVIRVQPDEAIYLKINNKVPGLRLQLDTTKLDLSYKDQYSNRDIPDAYERLLLDAFNGDKSLFIRNDELKVAWALFTPMLKSLEERKISPELYHYGSTGPVGAHYLASKYNVRWSDGRD